MTQILDSTDRLHLEVDNQMRVKNAVIEATQEIDSSFLDAIAAKRELQDRQFAPDDVHVASIPGAVVDHWFRNGFSIWDKNVTPADILKRLAAEDLGKFAVTSKSFG